MGAHPVAGLHPHVTLHAVVLAEGDADHRHRHAEVAEHLRELMGRPGLQAFAVERDGEFVGRTALYVSGGAEHQGPPGGGPVAAIVRMPSS